MRHKLRASALVFVGLAVLAASCGSDPAPSGAPPRTGSGAVEEGLSDEGGASASASLPGGSVGTFILVNLVAGVFQGVGEDTFEWVVSLVEGDPTAEQLKQIETDLKQLETNVAQLDGDIQSLRATVDQDFKDQRAVIEDARLQQARTTIDDAQAQLATLVSDVHRAAGSGGPAPDAGRLLGAYGDPYQTSALANLLKTDLHAILAGDGSNVSGGSLIHAADAVFAGQQADGAATAVAFDDRLLAQRLGLEPDATPEAITTACDTLKAEQPASQVCVITTPAGQVIPSRSYHDQMQALVNYYIGYQVRGLQVLLAAYASWDDGGRCPVPAQGECAVAASRAQEVTAAVVDNVRQQLAMAGAPVSTADRVVQNLPGDTGALWRTKTASATYSQGSAPGAGIRWAVPIDCTLAPGAPAPARPNDGPTCGPKDPPYLVTVPSTAPEDQICVGVPTQGRDVAAKPAGTNGRFDALPAEWSACRRPDAVAGAPATGLRAPTHQELQAALPKSPDTWVAALGRPGDGAPALGASTLLAHTPTQLVCGNPVPDDELDPWYGAKWELSGVNVNKDRWINGWAETWTRGAAWRPTNQFEFYEPAGFTYNTLGNEPAGGYEKGGPCGRAEGVEVCGGCGNGNALLPFGWTQCVLNNALDRDWCYGHWNYGGKDLPATTGDKLDVWGVHSLVLCPQQQTQSTGIRPPAWQMTSGCTAGDRPTGKDWEIPACKTPAGVWTLCGASWVDDILKPPPPPAPVPTTPPSTAAMPSTTAAPPDTAGDPSATPEPAPGAA